MWSINSVKVPFYLSSSVICSVIHYTVSLSRRVKSCHYWWGIVIQLVYGSAAHFSLSLSTLDTIKLHILSGNHTKLVMFDWSSRKDEAVACCDKRLINRLIHSPPAFSSIQLFTTSIHKHYPPVTGLLEMSRNEKFAISYFISINMCIFNRFLIYCYLLCYAKKEIFSYQL